MLDIHAVVKEIQEDFQQKWTNWSVTDDEIAAAIFMDHNIVVSEDNVAKIREEISGSERG